MFGEQGIEMPGHPPGPPAAQAFGNICRGYDFRACVQEVLNVPLLTCGATLMGTTAWDAIWIVYQQG
jgi:hypothetical protein